MQNHFLNTLCAGFFIMMLVGLSTGAASAKGLLKPYPGLPLRFDTEIVSRASGLFVPAEYGYAGSQQGMLRARATRVGDWEAHYLYSGF